MFQVAGHRAFISITDQARDLWQKFASRRAVKWSSHTIIIEQRKFNVVVIGMSTIVFLPAATASVSQIKILRNESGTTCSCFHSLVAPD